MDDQVYTSEWIVEADPVMGRDDDNTGPGLELPRLTASDRRAMWSNIKQFTSAVCDVIRDGERPGREATSTK